MSETSKTTPQALDESEVFAANLLASRFFEAAIVSVNGYGNHTRWFDSGRAMAAATLANAAATIYAANIQAKQAARRTRKAVKS